ncbi:uncharacterized protein LOC117317492 [Pecten maximus]|uniref:uncharacterized protein LOC117317492 n=1 Tax=Pecten maximus TaxID=6579 RepID=UPI0014584665|nr:uncharacterized protein LOC117317492 [Pecten maximus]
MHTFVYIVGCIFFIIIVTNMSAFRDLISLGKEMGLSGLPLVEFVRGEQDRERDERQLQRESTKQEEDRRRHERELQSEKEKIVLQRELEKEREERAVEEHRRRIEILTLEGKFNTKSEGDSHISSMRGPKLTPFDEDKDNMDSYLQRYERYATTQRWDKSLHWATNLSVLLKGRALDVFSRLPREQSLDYDILKAALLKRFDMTEDGFRKRFRTGRPESGETFTQFAVRLESYFVRWLEMGHTDKSFDALKDLMVRDQFLQACGNELTLFLKERIPSSIQEMSRLADQYAEARGNPTNLVRPKIGKSSSQGNPKRDHSDTAKETSSANSRDSVRQCYVCKSTEHLANKCPKKGSKNRVMSVTGKPTKNVSVGRKQRRKEIKQEVSVDVEVDDGESRLQDGTHMNVSCNVPAPTPCKMPVVEGVVGSQRVSVLRDTGCSGVVVKRSLVTEDQMTGEVRACTLADGSSLKVPTATVVVDTPYYVGPVVAWCMETPVYDLILGNIDGARAPDEPDSSWNQRMADIAVVETRAQRTLNERPYRTLKVPAALKEVQPSDIETAQQEDDSLVKIRDMVSRDEVKERRDGGKSRFFKHRGLIYREYQSPAVANGRTFKQLVVPTKYRENVLRLAHESMMSGHLGAKRTSDRIMMEFFWPGVNADVTRFCRSCDVCQRTFPKGRVSKVPLGTMPLIDIPFQRVAIDIIGPLQPATDRGNRYILTIVDYATRYPEAIALRGIETERVAEALVDVYSRVGIPREVLTDQGSQFTSELMREVSRLLSIRQLTTTPYHPMCNGLVERFNGTLKQMLKRMCSERPKDWDKYLNALLFSYREVPQESLGFSPFELLFGRTVRGPMMILRELWTKDVPDTDVKTTYQYVVDLKERLEETCKLAQEQLKSAKSRQAKYYNRKAKDVIMEPGQKVLILLPTKRNKLLMQWRGPYTIEERRGTMDYRVNVDGKVKTLHANLLRRYVERVNTQSSAVVTEPGVLSVVCASIVTDDTGSDNEDVSERQLETTPSPIRKESVDDVKVSDQLDQTQRRQIRDILSNYSDVLTDVPGKTTLVEHEIRLTTDDPVRVKGRVLPFHMKETIRREMDQMLTMGVIEPSESPYAAPVVIVKKKDGSNRFCIDYRQINRVTVFDAEPMPNADDIFSRLAGHRYFSRLDLSKGYWQVPMAKTSKPKTAFTTPVGLFQFTVMPFGLVNAPATFCRLMRKLLYGMSNIESFIDDILIYTQTWEHHEQILRELFDRLRKSGITAKPSNSSQTLLLSRFR